MAYVASAGIALVRTGTEIAVSLIVLLLAIVINVIKGPSENPEYRYTEV